MRRLTIFYDFACSAVALEPLKDLLGVRIIQSRFARRSPFWTPTAGRRDAHAPWRRLCGASTVLAEA